MKHFAMMLGVTLLSGWTWAQKPEKIKMYVVKQQDSTYYATQSQLWKKEVAKRPHDEEAWDNYYNATRYAQWFHDRNNSEEQQLLESMKRAIPNTYTYYKCAYRYNQGSPESVRAAEEALRRLPQGHDDYDTWVGYLLLTAQMNRLSEMARQYYETGSYSPAILQYNYNELQGMDEGGIYVGNGDASIIPKLLLQYGKEVHKDKIIVCFPMLIAKDYAEYVFKKLGLGPVPEPLRPLTSQEAYEAYYQQLMETIRNHTIRSLYFSAFNIKDMVPTWTDSLYNEGLVMKYSTRLYDNRAVKRRNVEERYLLDYLRQSFTPREWTTNSRLTANYAVLCSDLLPYYKKHDSKRYQWLYETLTQGINQTDLSGEEKYKYLRLLDK